MPPGWGRCRGHPALPPCSEGRGAGRDLRSTGHLSGRLGGSQGSRRLRRALCWPSTEGSWGCRAPLAPALRRRAEKHCPLGVRHREGFSQGGPPLRTPERGVWAEPQLTRRRDAGLSCVHPPSTHVLCHNATLQRSPLRRGTNPTRGSTGKPCSAQAPAGLKNHLSSWSSLRLFPPRQRGSARPSARGTRCHNSRHLLAPLGWTRSPAVPLLTLTHTNLRPLSLPGTNPP